MRKSDAIETKKRKDKILHAAVHHYIKTGVPASSKVLVGEYAIDCSSATARNILAELADEGYLAQPHASAGRVPTDKGYRAYVDMMEGVRHAALSEIARIRKIYEEKVSELEDVIINTSRALSSLSHYSGFITLPARDSTRIKDAELISVPGGKTLFVYVTNTGLVRHRLYGFGMSRAAARCATSHLRELIAGATIADAQLALESLTPGGADLVPAVLADAAPFLAGAFEYSEDMHIEGVSNIMALPEFSQLDIAGIVGPAMSDSRRPGAVLARVIRDGINFKDVGVIIGAETKCKGFECASAVIRAYKRDERPVGVLGILGPKRMEYSRMMAIVENVSKMLEKALEKI